MCADAEMVANLNVRVGTNDRMSLGTTESSSILEAAGQCTTEVGLEDLAIGIFHKAPCVVGITVLGQVRVDRLLTESDDSVDLLLGVGETGLDIQQVSPGIDLLRISMWKVGGEIAVGTDGMDAKIKENAAGLLRKGDEEG